MVSGISLLADLDLFDRLLDGGAFRSESLHFAELGDALFGGMMLLFHDVVSGLRGTTLTYDLDQFIGGIPKSRRIDSNAGKSQTEWFALAEPRANQCR